MKIPQFFLFSTLICAVLLTIGYLLATYWVPQASNTAVYMGILLSFITGGIAYVLTYSGIDKATQKFVAFLITGMFTKMMVGIIIVLVVVVEYKPVIKEYVIAYFLSYFIFTAFEVYGLMRKLRA